jgi:hypothetical protein
MAVGYEYTLERQENGSSLVRFPRIPEALTEGKTEKEARTNAIDCVITALEVPAGTEPCFRLWLPLSWRFTRRDA